MSDCARQPPEGPTIGSMFLNLALMGLPLAAMMFMQERSLRYLRRNQKRVLLYQRITLGCAVIMGLLGLDALGSLTRFAIVPPHFADASSRAAYVSMAFFSIAFAGVLAIYWARLRGLRR